MDRLAIGFIALFVVVGSEVAVNAAETETFTYAVGAGASTGAKQPRYKVYDYTEAAKITSPSNMSARDEVLDTGAGVTIRVNDSRFPGWTKLELYDGAKKVGELTKGPAEFTVKDLKTGYHAYSVLGTDGKGAVRPSNPVLVVVRR